MLQNKNRESRVDVASLAFLQGHKAKVERRLEQRQVALLRVALLHAGGSKELCVVKNISPSGLSARVYRKLVGGEHVQIEFRSGQFLSGAVVWERDWEVGIVFPAPIDVDSVLASRWITESGRGRSLPRIEVSCRGRIKSGSRSWSVELRDISQGGAKVKTQTPLADRGDVVLTLPDLPPVAGVIRWVGGTDVGISFNECIPFERLAPWIQMHRADSTVPVGRHDGKGK